MENDNSNQTNALHHQSEILGHVSESKPRYKIGDEMEISLGGSSFRIKILEISHISFYKEYKVEFLEDKSQKWLLASDLCNSLN